MASAQAEQWLAALKHKGYSFGEDGDAQLAVPPPQNKHHSWLTPLTSMGVLRAQGRDAKKFLQSQLTNDVEALAPGANCIAAWCDPKGRAQAVLRVHAQADDNLLAIAPSGVLDAIEKKLRMYVLRAKVTLTREDEAYGCMGQGLAPSPARGTDDCGDENERDVTVIQIDVSHQLVVAPFDAALAYAASAWADGSAMMDESAWRLAEIRSALPQVFPATMGEFVPQMINLELIGGISFSKGCYPGQEVVARSQYLGRIKRRMFHVSAKPGPALAAGEPILTQDGAKAGLVVQSTLNGDGQTELLAVLRSELVDAATTQFLDPRDNSPMTVANPPYSFVAPEDLTKL